MMHHLARGFGAVVLAALLPACGGSSSSSGGGGLPPAGPEIEVFTLNAALASAGSAAMGIVAQDQHVAVPVMIRNAGTAALAVTGAVTVTPTNCAASVRDAAPASIAAGDTAAFTVLLTAGTAGDPSVLVSIPSDDADENPFTFTLTYTLAAVTHALYATGGTQLVSSSFPGVAATATVNGAVTTGAGVGQYFHLLDRALYTFQEASPGDTDLFLRGLGAALPAAPLNLTSTLTTATGYFGQIGFSSGDNIVFTYNSGVPGAPTRLYSMAISGAAGGAPVELSGAVPGGVPAGVQSFAVSPRKDLVAFVGDFGTAGTPELFLAPVAGGARVALSAPLVARSLAVNSLRWLPDQSGLVYETAVTATGQQREINYVKLGAVNTVTRLNGAVPAGRTGVIADKARLSNTGSHAFFLSDEASGTGHRDVYVVSLLGGAVSTAVALNGGAVPGGLSGVADYGINNAGTKALFIADSGPANRPELWQSLIAAGVPATSKIVASPTNAGVQFDGNQGVVSDTVAWCLRDNVVNNRQDLQFIDLSVPVPTLTLVGINTSLGNVFPQPNGRIVFATGSDVASAMLSSTPGAVTLSNLRSTNGLITVLGDGVAFEGDNGSAPQEVFFNAIGGGAEIQIDGAEIAGGSSGVYSIRLFSSTRVFYQFFTAGNDQLWNANTGGAIVRNQTDTGGVANGGSLKLGIEPR